jgi:colanic acid biosynthesis glycosyl transferase WcaI
MTTKHRLLVLNQYYAPGVEATAVLLADLSRALADEFDVTVVTATLRGSQPGRFYENGIEVHRVTSTSFDRRRLVLRAINYATYLVQSLRIALALERPDVILCMTDPPIIGSVALVAARRFRCPLVVVSQDVFPEIAVQLKRIENPLLVAMLRALIGHYLRRADRVVAIGSRMRDRLIEKGARPERVSIIPNWVDTTAIVPQPRENEWAVQNGLADRFVVMHSGNIGHAQNLDALVRAAMFLRDLDRLTVLLIGTGARREDFVALAANLEVDAVRFLPYQPREVLSQSLAAAHLHVVGLARGLSGYVVPSRLNGILSAGRPVIVAADDDSETARVVREADCGVVVPPGRPELIARAIRSAYDGELDLERMARNARDYAVANVDRADAIAAYRTLLREAAR